MKNRKSCFWCLTLYTPVNYMTWPCKTIFFMGKPWEISYKWWINHYVIYGHTDAGLHLPPGLHHRLVLANTAQEDGVTGVVDCLFEMVIVCDCPLLRLITKV